MKKFNWNWTQFLTCAAIAGLILRVIYVQDMEYKEDEEYNFLQSQRIGTTEPWPWYGIPSGVYLVNPGMSIWVFAILAKLFGIHSPTSLANAVQVFALVGMALVIPFALKFVRQKEDRKTWLWAFCLAMVNPFLVFYQRKLWPEPFLPFFTMLTLMGWTERQRWGWAFIWGMVGAWLGQIHMSGFFFAAALFIWTLFFGKNSNWKGWLTGSIVGALPLLPWLSYVLKNPIHQTMTVGWNEILQFKYWVFWITNPLGLHLGNPLGLLRGQSHWAQISDFVRYPIWNNHPTYLVGLAHAVAAVCAIAILGRGLTSLLNSLQKGLRAKTRHCLGLCLGKESDTAFLQNSALWGCGILLTATGVVIRRYYMAVTFPLEFICLIRMANPKSLLGHRLLVALWIAELAISAGFVHYIHVNQGSVDGDYGQAYGVNHAR